MIAPTGDSPNVLLDLDPERGGQLSLTPSADGVVGVALAADSDPSLVGDSATFPVAAGQPLLLQVVAPGVGAVVTLPDMPVTLCPG